MDWAPVFWSLRREGAGVVEQAVLELIHQGPLAGPHEGLWVYLEHEDLAFGFAAVLTEPCPDLVGAGRLWLYVAAGRRGRGVGEALLGRALAYGRRVGLRWLVARAGGELSPFLEAHGFAEAHHPCVSHFRPLGRGGARARARRLPGARGRRWG